MTLKQTCAGANTEMDMGPVQVLASSTSWSNLVLNGSDQYFSDQSKADLTYPERSGLPGKPASSVKVLPRPRPLCGTCGT